MIRCLELYFEEPLVNGNLFSDIKFVAVNNSAYAKAIAEDKVRGAATKASKNNYQATDAEKELLALLAFCEAGNQGIEGMRRVISVVFNRIDDPRFPGNVRDVIYATGQFSVASNGSMEKNVPSDEARRAVEMELEERIDTTSLYFGRAPHSEDHLYKYKDHYFSR